MRRSGEVSMDFGTVRRQKLPTVDSLPSLCSATEDASLAWQVQLKPTTDPAKLFHGSVDHNAVEVRGATGVMLPRTWLNEPPVTNQITLSVLHEPAVFGGRIQGRVGRTHWAGQCLITREGAVTEDSFGVMDGVASYSKTILKEASGGSFEYVGPAAADRREGDYFFIGSIHRHFGHTMLEGFARLWAMEGVLRYAPDIRFVVYETDIPGFAYDLLGAAGVDRARIVPAGVSTVFERLFVPGVSMRTHHWITEYQTWPWQRVSAALAHDIEGLRKVYLSRAAVWNRALVNEKEVESLFEKSGFEILAPESMSIEEQVRLARSCSVIAGSVGSQLYLAAFMRRGGRLLVLAPENFYLKDDYLISLACNIKLDVCLGGPVDFCLEKDRRNWSIDLKRVSAFLNDSGVF